MCPILRNSCKHWFSNDCKSLWITHELFSEKSSKLFRCLCITTGWTQHTTVIWVDNTTKLSHFLSLYTAMAQNSVDTPLKNNPNTGPIDLFHHNTIQWPNSELSDLRQSCYFIWLKRTLFSDSTIYTEIRRHCALDDLIFICRNSVTSHCAAFKPMQNNTKLHSPITGSLTVPSRASKRHTCVAGGGGSSRGGGGVGGWGRGGGGSGGGHSTIGIGSTTNVHPKLSGDGGHQVLYQLRGWCWASC